MADDWRSTKLKPFREVLRDIPPIPGESYPMKVNQVEGPCGCGDPWKGAYSKHGYWYKFHEGTEKDYAKIVELANEQDTYFLVNRKVGFLNGNRLVVVKNLKNEILGAALTSDLGNFVVIGAYFIVEDFRHSGIGQTLFKHIFKNRNVVFHAMSHLLPTIDRFDLRIDETPLIQHVTIRNPSGFPELKNSVSTSNFQILSGEDITEYVEKQANSYSKGISLTNLFPINEDNCTVAVAVSEGCCIGYAASREVTGGALPRILVGPIHAESEEIVEVLLREVLKHYYNPETDYEFDPDVYAIYRRNVHFHVYETNEKVKKILDKLKGKTGDITIDRLYYKTTSNFNMPTLNLDKVYCLGDLHTSVL